MFVTSGLTSDTPAVITSVNGELNIDSEDVVGAGSELIVDSLETVRLLPQQVRIETNIIGSPRVFVLARDVRLAYPNEAYQSIAGIARSLGLVSEPITSAEQATSVARALEKACRATNGVPWWIDTAKQVTKDVGFTFHEYGWSEPMRLVHMFSLVSQARDVFDSAYYSHEDVRANAVASGMLHEAKVVDQQGNIVTCVGSRPLRVRVGKNVIDVTSGYTPSKHVVGGRVLATRVDGKGRFISRIKVKDTAWRQGTKLCLMEAPFGGGKRMCSSNKWIDQFGGTP